MKVYFNLAVYLNLPKKTIGNICLGEHIRGKTFYRQKDTSNQVDLINGNVQETHMNAKTRGKYKKTLC